MPDSYLPKAYRQCIGFRGFMFLNFIRAMFSFGSVFRPPTFSGNQFANLPRETPHVTPTPVPTRTPTPRPAPTPTPRSTQAPTQRPSSTPIPTPRPSSTLTLRSTPTSVPTPCPTPHPAPTPAPISTSSPVPSKSTPKPKSTSVLSPTRSTLSPTATPSPTTIRVVVVGGLCHALTGVVNSSASSERFSHSIL